ncbi:unnamed protein product, partial [Rotaria sp. Silwood1]
MYDHISHVGDNALVTIVAALLNIDANLQNLSLTDGGTHEAYFTLVIRSLFEDLVRFKLCKGSCIGSEKEFEHILRELLDNLEAYNLIVDICRIPPERIELFYPWIVKNIIKKLRDMTEKELYTIPVKWEEHALCVCFLRETNTIVIRIDNLNSSEKGEHEAYQNKDTFWI